MNLLIALACLLAQDAERIEVRIPRLIERLDAESLEDRERAAAELVKLGDPAVPHLKRAVGNAASPESAARLRKVLDEILEPAELRALLDRALSGKWSWYGTPERPLPSREVRQAACAEMKASAETKEGFRKAAPNGPEDWRNAKAAIATLKRNGAVGCLSIALLHSSYLTQLDAAHALADLKAWKAAPLAIDAAEALAVEVYGSKSATVHGFRQSGFAKALDELLGTSAAWEGDGQNSEALRKAIPIWREAYEKRLKSEAK